MNRSTLRLGAVALAGGALLAAGAVVATRPELVLAEFPALVELGERVDPGQALVALAATVLVLVAVLVAAGRYRETGAEGLRSDDPDDDERRSRPVVGASLEEAIERATDYESTGRSARADARETIRARLEPAAVDAYAGHAGIAEADAREAVSQGEWTTDGRAAAFLGEPSLSRAVWLYDLLTAEDPYRRSLAHTVGAIEAIEPLGALDPEGTSQEVPA